MKHGGGKCEPAEKLVRAQREGTDGTSPRPDRQRTEDETNGDRAEA